MGPWLDLENISLTKLTKSLCTMNHLKREVQMYMKLIANFSASPSVVKLNGHQKKKIAHERDLNDVILTDRRVNGCDDLYCFYLTSTVELHYGEFPRVGRNVFILLRICY